MEDKENLVLDHATMCVEWSRLWSSFGFSEHQWSSRAAKVEEYTRVKTSMNFIKYSYTLFFSKKYLENKLSNYKEQINKRKKLRQQSVEDYEELILRTGLTSLLDVCIQLVFFCIINLNQIFRQLYLMD